MPRLPSMVPVASVSRTAILTEPKTNQAEGKALSAVEKTQGSGMTLGPCFVMLSL